jgi:hypothetical protein
MVAVDWTGLVFYESSFRTYVLFSTKYRKYALVLAFGGVSFKDVIIEIILCTDFNYP